MLEEYFDIAIVGGGIVGAGAFYKLQKRHPNKKIVLFEKEDQFANHQTGNNSGVIHSGLYYKPGSFKAKNCVNGRKQLVAFAKEYNIPHDICGKVVVATKESEFPFMEKIFNNGIENNTEGIEKIDAKKIQEIEPECTGGIAGIWVPCTGIIDFRATTEKMIEVALGTQPNSKAKLGEEIINYLQDKDTNILYSNKNVYRAKHIIFCGGLQSDRLARKDKINLDMSIVGFRGDYFELAEHASRKVKNLIYPVPDPAFPFLGVHFTRMINGGVECGPNAVFTFKREGYNKTSFSLKDTTEALTSMGTWKFFAKHWKYGIDEYRRAFSKKLFLDTLKRLIPSLEMDDLVDGRSGVRAMALGNDGNMIDDFKIEHKGKSLHVLNAPSPAATAALSIGDQISDMAKEYFNLD